MNASWDLSYLLSARRRLWSDWADAQADLSLHWVHTHFVGLSCRSSFWGLISRFPVPPLCGSTKRAFHCLSQLMRLWYLSHSRPAKVQASLRIRAISPEPSLFAHMEYGSRRRVRPKIRHGVWKWTKGPTKNQTARPTGWLLRMCVWRMSLQRTKSTIITWAGSFSFTKTLQLVSDDKRNTPVCVGQVGISPKSLRGSCHHAYDVALVLIA